MGGWFNGGPLWPPHDGGCLAEGGGPPGAVTVKVDTPVPSMAEQSLWEVEVPAAMEELGLVCAAQEQYHALAAAPVVSSPSMRWRAWRGRRR